MKNETPKFAHLQYAVLHELDISIAEYWYLDMVYQLSRQGWCNKRMGNIAEDMRITRDGVRRLRDRLIERGLIIKGVANRVRTSEKVDKVYFYDKVERKSRLSFEKADKVYPKSRKSTPKNNKRITKNSNLGDLKELLQAKNPALYHKLYK